MLLVIEETTWASFLLFLDRSYLSEEPIILGVC